MDGKATLILGGCPRSGTTALARALNAHPQILLGNERFYRVIERNALTAEHFSRERFVRIEPGDTHDEPPGMEEGPNPHWLGDDPGTKYDAARVVGDKYPPVFRAYDMLADRFAQAYIVYVIRNPLSVAESYQVRAENVADRWPFDYERGILDWNESVAATCRALDEGIRIIVVAYETILRSADAVGALVARLGLDPERLGSLDRLVHEARVLAHKPAPRNETIRQHVCLNADFESYRALLGQHAIDGKARDAAQGPDGARGRAA